MVYTIYDGSNLIFRSDSDDQNLALGEPTFKSEIGKASSLEFTIYPSHLYYNQLHKLVDEIVAYEDDIEIFRGRIYEIDTQTSGEKKVTCEGDIAYLSDTLQPPDRITNHVEEKWPYTGGYSATYNVSWVNWHSQSPHSESYSSLSPAGGISYTNEGWGQYKTITKNTTEEGVKETLMAHFGRIIASHNSQCSWQDSHGNRPDAFKIFQIGNVTLDEANDEIEWDASNYRSTIDAIETDIINIYGGYLRTRRVGNDTYIDLLKSYNSTSSQTLTFGENIIDIDDDQSVQDIFTVFIPIGDDNLTIASENNDSPELVDEDGLALYGRIVKTETFSGVSDAAELKSLGQKYMQKNLNPLPTNLKITAIDLKWMNPSVRSIRTGDKVTISSPPHGVSRELDCISTQIQFYNPDKTTYELGYPEEKMSHKQHKESQQNAQTAADAKASGRAGGSATGKLYQTITEQGRQLQIDADILNILATRTTFQGDQIVEIQNELSVFRLIFDRAEGNYLETAVGIKTAIANVTLDLHYKNIQAAWKWYRMPTGVSVSGSASNLGGAVTINGHKYNVEVWGDVSVSGSLTYDDLGKWFMVNGNVLADGGDS